MQALIDAHHALWGTERIGADEKAMSTRRGRPLTDRWTFSTNGVSIQGRYGIPCVASVRSRNPRPAPNEITWKQDLRRPVPPCPQAAREQDGSATSFRQGAHRQRHQVKKSLPADRLCGLPAESNI